MGHYAQASAHPRAHCEGKPIPGGGGRWFVHPGRCRAFSRVLRQKSRKLAPTGRLGANRLVQDRRATWLLVPQVVHFTEGPFSARHQQRQPSDVARPRKASARPGIAPFRGFCFLNCKR